MSAVEEILAPISEARQTEIGPLPSDWQVWPLGRLLVQAPSYGINAPAVPYDLRYPAYIRITDITDDGRFNPDGRASVAHPNAQAYHLEDGDIVLARTGASTGKSYRYRAEDGALAFAGFLIRIRPDGGKLLTLYLSYQLQSAAYWNWVKTNSMRSGQPGINGKQYAAFPLAVPPTITEQGAIATALSDADELIEALECLIAKKRAVKQGAMQALLSGRTRLPGFSGEWANVSIGSLCEVVNGLTYAPSDVSQEGTLVLRSSNIQDDFLSFENNVFVKMDVPERTLVRSGDILICVRNGSRDLIGKCIELDDRCQGMAFGAFMAVLRTPLHRFILHQFRSDGMKRQIAEHLGATINQITNKSLKSFVVPVPPTEAEAMTVADVLSDMDGELVALETRLLKARAIKQGMMQQLLTGRVRLV